jgi:hypothetical protein
MSDVKEEILFEHKFEDGIGQKTSGKVKSRTQSEEILAL